MRNSNSKLTELFVKENSNYEEIEIKNLSLLQIIEEWSHFKNNQKFIKTFENLNLSIIKPLENVNTFERIHLGGILVTKLVKLTSYTNQEFIITGGIDKTIKITTITGTVKSVLNHHQTRSFFRV